MLTRAQLQQQQRGDWQHGTALKTASLGPPELGPDALFPRGERAWGIWASSSCKNFAHPNICL